MRKTNYKQFLAASTGLLFLVVSAAIVFSQMKKQPRSIEPFEGNEAQERFLELAQEIDKNKQSVSTESSLAFLGSVLDLPQDKAKLTGPVENFIKLIHQFPMLHDLSGPGCVQIEMICEQASIKILGQSHFASRYDFLLALYTSFGSALLRCSKMLASGADLSKECTVPPNGVTLLSETRCEVENAVTYARVLDSQEASILRSSSRF